MRTKCSRYSSSIDPLNVALTSAKVALLRMFAIIGFIVNTQVVEGLREYIVTDVRVTKVEVLFHVPWC